MNRQAKIPGGFSDRTAPFLVVRSVSAAYVLRAPCSRRRYTRPVPIIAFFFGIIVRMFYREHEPAHFHAEHQGQHGKFDFDGKMTIGDIQSKTALRLIREWAMAHREELEANWAKMKDGKPLDRIAPLE